MPPESPSTASRRRFSRRASAKPAVHRRAHVAHPVEAREHRQVVLDRDVHVEVVELRHHAHQRARLLRLARQLVAEDPDPALVRCAWPVSSRIVVDLPAPFGPSRPRQMPFGTSRSRPSTAVIGPNLFTTPCSSIAAKATSQTTNSTKGERTFRIFGQTYKEKLIARG